MKRLMSDRYFLGRKCVYCNSNKLYRLKIKKVKCKYCKKYYSLKRLRRNLEILYYFYLELSARKTAKELNLNYKTEQEKFMQFRRCINNFCANEAQKLNGELELDESYFGGKRKENRERGANNKTIVFGIIKNKILECAQEFNCKNS